MPFRRNLKYKRPVRRKSTSSRAITGKRMRGRKLVSVSRDPFPFNMFCKLNYTESVSPITGTGLNGGNYLLNGPYDPRTASGGGQPRYYDTLLGADATSAPYSNYTVYGAKVHVDFWNNSSSVSAIAGITGFPSDSSAPGTAYEALERKMETKYVKLSPNTGGSAIASIDKYFSIKKMEGVTNVNDNANLSANYNALPTRVSTVSMWAEAADDGVSNVSVLAKISITYYVQLRKKNSVGDS